MRMSQGDGHEESVHPSVSAHCCCCCCAALSQGHSCRWPRAVLAGCSQSWQRVGATTRQHQPQGAASNFPAGLDAALPQSIHNRRLRSTQSSGQARARLCVLYPLLTTSTAPAQFPQSSSSSSRVDDGHASTGIAANNALAIHIPGAMKQCVR